MQYSLGCRLPSLCSGSSSGFALLVNSDNWLHTFFSQEKKVYKEKRNVAALRCRALIDAFWEKSLAKPRWSNTRRNLCAQYVVNLYREQSLEKSLAKNLSGVTPAGVFLIVAVIGSALTGCRSLPGACAAVPTSGQCPGTVALHRYTDQIDIFLFFSAHLI